MSNKTLAHVVSAGGPDPGKLTSALQIIDCGQVLQAQRVPLIGVNAAVFKLAAGVAPLRVGAVAKVSGGGVGVLSTTLISKGTFAEDAPSTGLTIGAGNSSVRIVPKAGYTVRYAQFNPGGPADTGNYFLASQGLSVFVTVAGRYAEIWVSLANDATATVTSLSSAVQAALRGNAEVMSVLDAVDGDAGNGTGVAAPSPISTVAAYRPSCSVVRAAGVGVLPAASPGTFVTSFDGRLLFFIDTVVNMALEYAAAPAVPMDVNFYPGSM